MRFEGLGVDRHTDLVSHNHGSMPGNTPVFAYLSRRARGRDCGPENKRIERACKPKSSPRGKGAVGRPRGRNTPHWRTDHCDGLNVPLSSKERGQEYVTELKERLDSLPEQLEYLDSLKGELQSMAVNAGAHAAAKWAARAGVKQAVGTTVPFWGNVAMGVVSAVDGAITIGNVAAMRQAALDGLQQLEVLSGQLSEAQKLADKLGDLRNLSESEILELAADGQGMIATLNACTRARKCMLVPFGPEPGTRNRRIEHSQGNGCCRGQTGHHLIYDAMAKKGNCPGYSRESAPTVCVEGTSQNHGTHGLVHGKMDETVALLVKNNQIGPDGNMSLDQAVDAAAKSHAEAFPLSGCSEKCIKAQLDSYYRNTCPNGRFAAVDKQGNPHKPDTGDGGND